MSQPNGITEERGTLVQVLTDHCARYGHSTHTDGLEGAHKFLSLRIIAAMIQFETTQRTKGCAKT